jgi:release factor H-coupled RctB family protein
MGNSIQKLNEKVALVASQTSWIEGDAIEQLKNSSKLEGMLKVCGLPDLHPGKGHPIGASFLSKDIIYPYLVGSDIGCGMSLWQTDLDAYKLNLDKTFKLLTRLEEYETSYYEENLNEIKAKFNINYHNYDYNLGTIGGSNHFFELQKVDQIMNENLFEQYMNKKKVYAICHTGSRGLGHAILENYITKHNSKGVSSSSLDAKLYLQEHNKAINFAQANREFITQNAMSLLKTKGKKILDVFHNYIEALPNNEFLHRKGAANSYSDIAIIPGSRGDLTYIVKPIANESSLYSIAHGAGRKWKRSECRCRIEAKFNFKELHKTKLGSLVICDNKDSLYEEAPEAYKNISQVIQDLLDANLIEIICTMKPLITFKQQEEK